MTIHQQRGGRRSGGESLEPKQEEVKEVVPTTTSSFSSEVIRETDIPTEPSSTSSSSTSIVSLFSNKNFWIAMLVVLLILSFLGVNLVMLLGQIFQPIVNVFWILITQILSLFGYTTGTVINKTMDVVSGTAKASIEIADGTVQSVGNLLIKGSSSDIPVTTQAQIASNILGTSPSPSPAAVATMTPTQTTTMIQQVVPSTLDDVLSRPNARSSVDPLPDASTSAIQSSSSWCFVGEMNGKRTCADVSSSTLCLSGQVYKTQADCQESHGSKQEGFTAPPSNGALMMATPSPTTAATPVATAPGTILQTVVPPPVVQTAPTGAVVQLPSLGPPQYMGPPNFPPPGMTAVQLTVPVVGKPQLGVGPPNYISLPVNSDKE